MRRLIPLVLGTGVLWIAGCESSPTAEANPTPEPIPAFPGAQGYGAAALNECARERVLAHFVTSLTDRGPGSLRQVLADAEAASSTGALQVVLFRVGGYVQLESPIRFGGRCLYLAGQSAPGAGITVTGNGLEFVGDARDVVIRFLRFRPGNAPGADDAIIVRQGRRFVFDHLSLSWAPGSLLRFSRTEIERSGAIREVTVQRSLLGESLSSHPTGLQIGGQPDDDNGPQSAGWRDVTHFSIHRNAFVSNSHRNPNARGLYIEVINNLIHNWNLDAGQTGRGAIVDWVANAVQAGPMTRPGPPPFGIHPGSILEPPFYEPSIHSSGNRFWVPGGSPAPPSSAEEDEWEGPGRMVGWYRGEPVGDLAFLRFRRVARIGELTDAARFPVATMSASAVPDELFPLVGAAFGLDCSGQWFERRDAVDGRLMDEARMGRGWSDRPGPANESQGGGLPFLDPGAPCAYSTRDGIPDGWKASLGIDVSAPGTAQRIAPDGYSYLEHYLNGTRP